MSRPSLLLLLILAAGGVRAAESPCASGSPGALWGAVWVYDPAREAVLLFGGARDRRDFVGSTWTWTDAGWRCHEVAGPAPRAFAAAAFDPGRNAVVLHGGRGAANATLGDTWEWNGSRWRELSGAGPRLDHHRIAWSAPDEALLMFGGWTGDGVSGASWIWDGRGWADLGAAGPPPRSAFAMAADPDGERVVVHGGLWIEGQYADAWAWDGERWTVLWGPYDHSSVDHHAMVFDLSGGRFLLFGGKNYRYRVLDRTWILRGAALTPLTVDGPPGRHSFGFTYDTKRSRAILFGGKIYDGDEQIALDDLWLWSGSSWSAWRPTEP